MTAASILSSSPSASTQDSIDGTESALSVSSSALPAAPVADDNDPLGPLALLDDVTSLDADSLSLAVGILRQRQPVDGSEGDDGMQLSERLRDFLLVLRKRPGSSMPGAQVWNGAADLCSYFKTIWEAFRRREEPCHDFT
jgi:hypothetical protein